MKLNKRSAIELSDCIIKHHRQHPQRNPPSRTPFPPPSTSPIPRPQISSPPRKRHQHTLRHGHGIPRNNLHSNRIHDPRPPNPNRKIPLQHPKRTNLIPPMSGYSPHSPPLRIHRSLSKTGCPGAGCGARRSETSSQERGCRLSACMVYFIGKIIIARGYIGIDFMLDKVYVNS